MMADADDRRRQLGEAAILSPTDAAALLPMRLADALALLREEGLIRCRRGRQVVIWGDVIRFFREPEPAANSLPPPTPVKPMPRADLRPKR
jgi:hypothetical protein